MRLLHAHHINNLIEVADPLCCTPTKSLDYYCLVVWWLHSIHSRAFTPGRKPITTAASTYQPTVPGSGSAIRHCRICSLSSINY